MNASLSNRTAGTVSKELAPHVKSILGVDISQRGIEQYNENFKDDEKASGICVELKGEEGELSDARFDMIFVSPVYLTTIQRVYIDLMQTVCIGLSPLRIHRRHHPHPRLFPESRGRPCSGRYSIPRGGL